MPSKPSVSRAVGYVRQRLAQIKLNIWRKNNSPNANTSNRSQRSFLAFLSRQSTRANSASSKLLLSKALQNVGWRLRSSLTHLRSLKKVVGSLRTSWKSLGTHSKTKFKLPQQIVRWDLLGVTLSYLWGKANGTPLPRWARQPLYKAWGFAFKANLNEAAKPLSEYSCLKDFFTRSLKEGARTVCNLGMASPVDGKVLSFGEVKTDRVEHVKGITYTASGFLGLDVPKLISALQTKPNPTKLYHCVLYLAPGDYHRIHSPVAWDVTARRHFPGTLFPVAPGFSKMIPNLLALNERVVLEGSTKEEGENHGRFFSLSAVGAYNVGSMSFHFDPTLNTNVITRDFKCPNLRYFPVGIGGGGGGIGTHAYVKDFSPSVSLSKGEEMGLF
eukprot:TRINITY_DN3516_c0_g5_i1.p1 TRINITY_DN3516_c0_g5~~TRINITY_DN3516_c0_g5_i1.p1  ORF type:complete len:386 (+),score=89.33 TRINITY_DN3516_c0_g5_i1:158-1315(+)